MAFPTISNNDSQIQASCQDNFQRPLKKYLISQYPPILLKDFFRDLFQDSFKLVFLSFRFLWFVWFG